MSQLINHMHHYRKDIEGLRAIAVILVILFHYEISVFTGGFVGVDVFFVISGFVITELLTRNLHQQKFSFAEFYRRRILRLVPAFLVVSTLSFLMISPFYMDDDYYVFAKSWMASLVGLSNIYYFQELSQYFSADTHVITLLHTWSLAVEEQFYFIWPTLLYVLYTFRRTWLDNILFFWLLWLAFFGLSVYLAETHTEFAYYLLPARIFELMLGAGLSLHKTRLPAFNKNFAEGISILGALLILATSIGIDYQDHFPGYNALWPTAGTAMIIIAGMQHQSTVIARLLRTSPMLFLGAISYSLYLWHWPPIALANYQLLELNLLQKLGLILTLVLFSWLSFRFLESRLRYANWSLKKAFFILVLPPLIFIWAIQTTIRISDDISFRMPKEKQELYRITQQSNSNDIYKACFKGDFYHFERGEKCVFGDNPDPEKVNALLIGDSHATSFIGFIEKLIEGQNLTTLLVTQASTPFLLYEDTLEAFFNNEEKNLRNKALQEYLSLGPKTVFVSARWDSYLNVEEFNDYFYRAFKWLLEQQHTVYVIEDAPILPSASHAYCLIKTGKECTITRAMMQEYQYKFLKMKARLQKDFPSIRWIRPNDVICKNDICNTALNGIPLYRDESHLNYIGAKLLGDYYLREMGNPLSKPKNTDSSLINTPQ